MLVQKEHYYFISGISLPLIGFIARQTYSFLNKAYNYRKCREIKHFDLDSIGNDSNLAILSLGKSQHEELVECVQNKCSYNINLNLIGLDLSKADNESYNLMKNIYEVQRSVSKSKALVIVDDPILSHVKCLLTREIELNMTTLIIADTFHELVQIQKYLDYVFIICNSENDAEQTTKINLIYKQFNLKDLCTIDEFESIIRVSKCIVISPLCHLRDIRNLCGSRGLRV